MAYKDLREYLQALEERGLLKRVGEELSPELEIPEVLRQAMYRRGPALLFEKVKGHPGWRVVGNIFGDMDRIRLALGAERLEEIGERLLRPLSAPPPVGLLEKVKAAAEALELGRYMPRYVRSGDVKEVVEEPDLTALPAFKSWPKDAGRYITYGVLITKRGGVYNLGVYRIQILGRGEAIVHAQIHKRASELFAESGGCVDAAIAIGGDPAFLLSAMMPTPYPLDEYLFAGVLRGEGVEVTMGEAVDLYIPARAEAVIEGCIDVKDLRREGPFGDHYGVYDEGAYTPSLRLRRCSGGAIRYTTAQWWGPRRLRTRGWGRRSRGYFCPYSASYCPRWST